MGKREMPAKEHRTQRRPQDSRKSQDNRRPRDSRRTQDSRKPQGNRRPEKSRRELEEVYYNPAKSMAGDRRGSGIEKSESLRPKRMPFFWKNERQVQGLSFLERI